MREGKAAKDDGTRLASGACYTRLASAADVASLDQTRLATEAYQSRPASTGGRRRRSDGDKLTPCCYNLRRIFNRFFLMATSSLDRGRITARVPLHVQETLETAALLVGSTVNQFVVQAALSEAERIIEQERVIRLSADDARYFLDALDNPLPPNSQLMSALQAYAASRNDQTGSLDWTPRPKRV